MIIIWLTQQGCKLVDDLNAVLSLHHPSYHIQFSSRVEKAHRTQLEECSQGFPAFLTSPSRQIFQLLRQPRPASAPPGFERGNRTMWNTRWSDVPRFSSGSVATGSQLSTAYPRSHDTNERKLCVCESILRRSNCTALCQLLFPRTFGG